MMNGSRFSRSTSPVVAWIHPSLTSNQIIQFTSGWTGAEIEQCVISALTKARLEDRTATEHDLVNASVGGVPLSRAMKEQINHIRQWAFQRAVRASPGPVAR